MARGPDAARATGPVAIAGKALLRIPAPLEAVGHEEQLLGGQLQAGNRGVTLGGGKGPVSRVRQLKARPVGEAFRVVRGVDTGELALLLDPTFFPS